MKIAIIGTGYVGLPTGVGLAELGNQVVCVDKIAAKIEALTQGKVTLYEEGLEELYLKHLKSGALRFTLDMREAVDGADVVMIAVGTPPHPVTKEADLQYIYAAAEELAAYLDGYTVVATKSTVPVGTGDEIEAIIKKVNPAADVDVISLPEFLREGFAVHDFFHPDRIVIGTDSRRAREVMCRLYAPFADKTEMLEVSRRSSETIKYASNAFLAMKIHYINEMADFCEKAGADINEVAKGMGTDMGRKFGAMLNLIETTIAKNDERKLEMAKRVAAAVKHNPEAKIAVLGLAFKGGTDDCRESPAMQILEKLLHYNRNVTVYDPQAMENARAVLGDRVSYAADPYEACAGADIAVILTEWENFKHLDLEKLKAKMLQMQIMDLRNLLNKEEVCRQGFCYSCIGMKN